MSRRDFLKSLFYFSLTSLGLMGFTKIFGERAAESKMPDSNEFEAAYLKLHKSGELKKRGERLWQIMHNCMLCPRACGTDRLVGNEGNCHATRQLEIASFNPHFGEERPLVATGGSGAIFMTNCSLRCVFCINWKISQEGVGAPKSIEDLAGMMIYLQNQGCHNINFVTPTHYVAHIVKAVDSAAANGLHVPLVYNTCGWERLEVLKELDGIIDIYLPDFKYFSGEMAGKYSTGAYTYPEVTQKALLEMQRQVGVAKPGPDGIMRRGLMIRHLVMPNGVSGTKEVVQWIAQNLPKNTYLNLMSQYRPMYKAKEYPEIARGITIKEYQDAVGWAREAGLTNLDIQGSPY